MRIFLLGLFAVSTIALAMAQATYSIDGVAFEENEVAAYESAVSTHINEVRRIRAKAEEAIQFFNALDPSLFNATEKSKILEARTVIKLAAKRQIEALTAEPVTAVDVKLDLLEKAVAADEPGAQAALDAFNAEHPE